MYIYLSDLDYGVQAKLLIFSRCRYFYDALEEKKKTNAKAVIIV